MNSGTTATIATSIMPRRIEVQQAAVRSWEKLGFKIISVNIEPELAIVRPLFPGIEFISVPQESLKSPLVPISCLMEKLKKCNSDIGGIVNSDIILSTSEDFISFLWDKTQDNGLIYGHRIDVDDVALTVGNLYAGGYDYFFFRKELLDISLSGGFTIGSPWWDLWFPIVFALNGVKLRHLISPVGYHPKHSVSWDLLDQEVGKRKFCSSIKETYRGSSLSTLSQKTNTMIDQQSITMLATRAATILLFDAEPVMNTEEPFNPQNLFRVLNNVDLHMELLYQSRSWRWTAPARCLAGHLRYLKRRVQRLNPFWIKRVNLKHQDYQCENQTLKGKRHTPSNSILELS